jgi:ABC-type histidine transport system ATPase subunit
VYAQEVWDLVSCWTNGLVEVPSRTIRLEGWWNAVVSNKSKDEAMLTAAMVIYTAWNLWKERNRRVFEGVTESPTRLLAMIKEEVQVRRLACGEEGELFTS